MSKQEKIVFNPVITALIVLQLLFIVFMVFSFQNVLKTENPVLSVNVDELNAEIDGLPEDAKQEIDYSIYQAIASNSISGNNVQKTGVYIRDNSLIKRSFDEIKVNYVSFIADIPDVNQSYRLVYIWTSDGKISEYVSPDYKAVTFCLPKTQLVYGEFDCVEEKSYAKKEIIANLIKGNEYSIPGYNDIGISFDSVVSEDDFRIRFNYMACESQCSCVKVDERKKQEAIDAFEEYYVYGLGFVPEEIPYYYYNCGR